MMIQTHPAGNRTGLDLTLESIPECKAVGNQALDSSSSFKSYPSYQQSLAPWTDFEQEVRETFKALPWDQCDTPITFQPDVNNLPENHLFLEQFLYGDDKSNELERYVQHVLHVMSAVARGMGIGTRFGYWKAVAPRESEQVEETPDYAILDSDRRARCVGLGRTPKDYGFFEAYSLFRSGNQGPLRKFIGQISKYMHELKLKYGFLSTYDYTIFLKQAEVNGMWTMYVSNPIPRTTPTTEADQTHETPDDLHGKVSLRECMLHLLNVTQNGSYTAENLTPMQEWVGPGIPPTGSLRQLFAKYAHRGRNSGVVRRGRSVLRNHSPNFTSRTRSRSENSPQPIAAGSS